MLTIGATTYRIVYNKSCYTTDTIYLGDIFMEHLKQRLKEEGLRDTSIDEILQYVRDMIDEACYEVEGEFVDVTDGIYKCEY